MAKGITHFKVKIIRYDERAKAYISYCPSLDLYSQGTTKTRALEAIQDTIESWINICSKHGTLDEALKRKGISVEILDSE